jgi:hypothetical protein
MEKQLSSTQREIYNLILSQKGKIVTYPKLTDTKQQTVYVTCIELVKLGLIKIDHDQTDCISFCLPEETSFQEYQQNKNE